jgi:flagellin
MRSLSLRNTSAAFSAARLVGDAQEDADRSMYRLATGLRINRAADDAAGLSVSEKMRAQINGLSQAARNAKDADAVAKTADGILAEVGNILVRIRGLAVQSLNDVNTPSERASLQTEVSALQTEIVRLASSAEFGGQRLFDGTYANKRFLVGANAGQDVSLSLLGLDASSLGAGIAVSDGTMSSATALASGATTGVNNVAAQTVSLMGPRGSASGSISAGDDAGTIAQKFNVGTAASGVSASVSTNLRLTSTSPASSGTATVTWKLSTKTAGVQGPIATITGTIGAGGNLSTLVSQLNGQTGMTGVSAAVGTTSNELVLTSSTGADIVLTNVVTTDSSGTATLLSATGLRPDATGALVASGASVSMSADTGVIVGGALSLSANGALTATTTSPGTVFSSATTAATRTPLAAIRVATTTSAAAALPIVDNAFETVNEQRGVLGAFQNRLESAIAALESSVDNLTAARTRIVDADVAEEAATFARSQVLIEAGVSVLAQANQSPRMALKLLTSATAAP